MLRAVEKGTETDIMNIVAQFTDDLSERGRFAEGYSEAQASPIRPGDVGIFDLKDGGTFKPFCSILDDPTLEERLEVTIEILDSGERRKHNWYRSQMGSFTVHDSLPEYNVLRYAGTSCLYPLCLYRP